MADTLDKSYKFDEKRRNIILESLRQGVTRGRAAEAAGIARSTLYHHLKGDPDFAQAVEDAEECAIDKVEDALWRKAVSGHPTCMIFYLKNKRPEVFKEISRFEGKVKQTGPDGVPITRERAEDYDDVLRKLAGMSASSDNGEPVDSTPADGAPGFDKNDQACDTKN